jgi:hypothetical protein
MRKLELFCSQKINQGLHPIFVLLCLFEVSFTLSLHRFDGLLPCALFPFD